MALLNPTRRRRLAVALLLLAVLAGAVALGLFPQEPGRAWIESRLRALVGPRSRIGRVHLVPGRLAADIDGLVLDSPAWRLEVDHVHVVLAPQTLRGGGVFIDRLAMSGARLLLRPAPPAPPPSTPLGPIVVRGIEVPGAMLRYETPQGPVTLGPIDVRGALGGGVLEAVAAGGTWERASPVALGPVRVRLVSTPALDLTLQELDAGLARTRVRAAGPLGRPGRWEPGLTFDASADLAELNGLAPTGFERGRVTARGRAEGAPDALAVTADLDGEALRAGQWTIDRASAHVAREAAGPTRVTGTAQALGGRARFEGRLDGRQVEARVVASGLDLARLRTLLGLTTAATGSAGADVTVHGALDGPLQVEARLDGAGAAGVDQSFTVSARAAGPVRLDPLHLGLEWEAALTTTSATAALRSSALQARGTARGALPPAVAAHVEGTLGLSTPGGTRDAHVTADGDATGARIGALALTVDGLDLAAVDPRLRGRAGVALHASGPVDGLTGAGTVEVPALSWEGNDLGAARGTVTLRGGAADLTLALPALRATADAHVDRGRRGLAGRFALQDTPLATLAAALPPERRVEGALSAAGTFDVPLADPAAAVMDAEVRALEIARGGVRVHAERPFTIGLREGRLALSGLRLGTPGLTLEASGSAGLAAPRALDLALAASADLAALPAPERWSMSGQVRSTMAVSGTAAHPLVTGFATLDGADLASPGMPAARVEHARIALEGTRARVEQLGAAVAGGTIDVTGHVPLPALLPAARRRPDALAPDEGADLHVAWSGVEAAQLLEALRPGAAATLQATLAGAVHVQGGLATLAEVRATLAAPALTARSQDVAFELAPFEVHLENGQAATDALQLTTAGGVMTMAGSVDLVRRRLDVAGHGAFDLRALSPFVEAAALTGSARLDLAVDGPLDAPRPHGTLNVRDGTLRFRLLPQALTGLSADLSADGPTVTLAKAGADFAGGTLAAEGTALLGGAGVSDVRLTLTGRGLALRYPEGLRSRLETDLTFTGRSGAFLLAGTVKVLRGLYDLDTALEESLTAPPPAAPAPFLRSIGLDVNVVTEGPLLVRNSLARLQATGRLAVRGDMETPAPIGSLDIEPGGKVFLQGRAFTADSGRLAYSGTWDPQVALEASARIADVDHLSGGKRADVTVTVGVQGRLLSPQLTLRSDPGLSRQEIVNLVTIGDSQKADARLAMVGAPAAALLTGRLTRGLRSLGFDEVRLQPELVARENGVGTGARFTFGKRLAPRVNLVYSLSLTDPEARFVEVELTPARDVTLDVRRNDSGSFTYGAGQRFRFGGAPRRREASDPRVHLSGVLFPAGLPLSPAEAQKAAGLRAGQRRTVWDLQDAADRLRGRLVERGYLEAEVGARFEGQAAAFVVRSGPLFRWTVRGFAGAPDLTRLVRRALFEEEALESGRDRLLADLRRRGHLRARVATRTDVDGQARTLVFEVEPGPRLEAEVTFPGATALAPGRLLKAAGGAGALLADPAPALAAIEGAYRDAHFLEAKAGPVATEDAGGGRVKVVVPVREGALARLAAVRFEGATVPEAELARAAGVAAGAAYDDAAVLAAGDRLRALYFGRGYGGVRVSARVAPQGHDLALVFQVFEGERVTVAGVELRGLRRTRAGLVRRQVTLRPGDPLDPRRVAEMERRLMDLGVFSRATASVSGDNPATVTVTLEEGDRLRSGYLVSHDGDTGTRGEIDGELRGLLGAGVSLGGRLSLGADLRDARGFVGLPALLPTGHLTLSAFRLSEDLPLAAGDDSGDVIERIQTGGQLQATRPLARTWDLLYGYRLKRTRVVSRFVDSTRWVAGVDVSVASDTRDDALDARTGRFLSLSLEIAPKALGSDFDFVKGFAQAFFSHPLRERWTWAHGYRLGLAHPFHGEPLVSDEGFEAGGANSLRGFASGSVGPADFVFGRQAVVVVNQELRYHHPSGLGAALFYDAGNTFATPRDLSLRLRHVLGAGLRYSSPIGLLRLDLGFPLGRREGEPAAKLFFSFGQAF